MSFDVVVKQVTASFLIKDDNNDQHHKAVFS